MYKADAPGFIINATDVDNDSDYFKSYTGPTMDVVISHNETTGTFDAEFTRLAYASDIVTGEAGKYLAALEDLIGVGTYEAVDAIDSADPRYIYALLYAAIEQQPTAGAIRTTADRAARQHSPRATANAVPTFATASRLSGSLFADRLRLAGTLPDDDEALRASIGSLSGNAYANLAPGGARRGIVAWATPFYQRGRLDGASGYGDHRERVGGVSLGAAAVRGDWAFGLSAHFLNLDIDGDDGDDADAKGYGFNLGLGRRFCLGSLTPWLELTGGYTWYDFEQRRREDILLREHYRSDPGVHAFNGSALLSNEFAFGRFSLTPRAGMDYARVDMENYREHGGSRALKVHSDATDSVRSVVGAALSYQATRSVRLEARGDYWHEFADKRSDFSHRDANGLLTGFKARGQDTGRESGRLGAGVHWRPVARAELGLDYDLHLAKNYVAHRFSAQVKLAF